MRWVTTWLLLALLFAFVPQAAFVQSDDEDAASEDTAESCRTPWTDGLSRPDRFTLVLECIIVTGTVLDVRPNQDRELQIRLLLDEDPGILNARNVEDQRGGLLVAIEPWQLGTPCTVRGCDEMEREAAPFCPTACFPRVGDRLQVTSAIVTDNEPGRGWSEAHSPSWIEVLSPPRDTDAAPTVPGQLQPDSEQTTGPATDSTSPAPVAPLTPLPTATASPPRPTAPPTPPIR